MRKIIFIFLSVMATSQLLAEELSTLNPSSETYNSSSSRDPFKHYFPEEEKEEALSEEPPQEIPPALPAFNIQGIIWEGHFPMAIVNDQVLKIGDTLEGATLIEIEKTGITFLYYGRKYKLSTNYNKEVR